MIIRDYDAFKLSEGCRPYDQKIQSIHIYQYGRSDHGDDRDSAAAGLLALVIALLTVSFQAVKVALANPVEALRYE